MQPIAGGGAHRLTDLKGFLATPRWSPDGNTHRAAVYRKRPARRRTAGAIDKDCRPVEQHIYEQRLGWSIRTSAESKPITPADTYVYEYDWAPDSDRLACTASKGIGDNNWWIAQLFTISLASGEIRRSTSPPPQIAESALVARWQQIAFIGGIMSDEGSTGGDIYAVPAAGGPRRGSHARTRQLTQPGCDGCPPGSILFTETVDGGSALDTLDPATRSPKRSGAATKPSRRRHVVSVSDDGKLAAMRSSWTLAPRSGPARTANGPSAPTSTMPSSRSGAKPKNCTGQATARTSRAGSFIR